jgi:hypothetical protein
VMDVDETSVPSITVFLKLHLPRTNAVTQSNDARLRLNLAYILTKLC